MESIIKEQNIKKFVRCQVMMVTSCYLNVIFIIAIHLKTLVTVYSVKCGFVLNKKKFRFLYAFWIIFMKDLCFVFGMVRKANF